MWYNKGTMSRKQIVILAASGVFVALVAFFGFLNRQGIFRSGEAPAAGVGDSTAGAGAEAPAAYSPEVPKGAVETKPQSEILVQSPAGEVRGAIGTYAITASARGYEPSELAVPLGNAVTVELTAQGGSYDLYSESAGFYVSAPDGGKGTVSFTPSVPGTFLFECRDLCPPGGKISGTLVVLPE